MDFVYGMSNDGCIMRTYVSGAGGGGPRVAAVQPSKWSYKAI